MDLSSLYVLVAGVVAVSFVQVMLGIVLGYAVLYVFFRVLGRRLSIKSYVKFIISMGLDVADFFVVFQGFDLFWDGALGLVGMLLWGGRFGWLQLHEIIPYPVDGFVPSLSISGVMYIMKYERRAR